MYNTNFKQIFMDWAGVNFDSDSLAKDITAFRLDVEHEADREREEDRELLDFLQHHSDNDLIEVIKDPLI